MVNYKIDFKDTSTTLDLFGLFVLVQHVNVIYIYMSISFMTIHDKHAWPFFKGNQLRSLNPIIHTYSVQHYCK